MDSSPKDTPPPEPCSDELEEYGGVLRNFETLDSKTAAAILRRRRSWSSTRVPKAASLLPPQGAASTTPAPADPLPGPEAGPIRLESKGRTLIVGRDAGAVAACGLRLARRQPCLMMVETASSRTDGSDPGPEGLLRGTDLHIRGGLGSFRATARIEGRPRPLNRAFAGAPERFDLVLDLRPAAARDQILPPPGYYAPEGDPEALESALRELPGMIGVFEKPRFVCHHAGACAGPEACGGCLAVCPSGAVAIVDGVVRIDQAACPGCGLCAAVCPTGAMQGRHPSPQDLLVAVHGRIADARLESRSAPTVVFRQASDGDPPLPGDTTHRTDSDTHDAEGLPCPPGDRGGDHQVLSFPLMAIGCAGPEVWLGALAYGAGRVIVVLPASYPQPLKAALSAQHAWAADLVAGLGHSRRRLHLDVTGKPVPALKTMNPGDIPVAGFAPFQSKRALIRDSAAHLAASTDTPAASVPLPGGAPFGAVVLDSAACTLCMACCGVCPTGALCAPGDAPALALVESACIQCGLCRRTCPEQALGLEPRMLWNPVLAARSRALWSQAPLACIRCGRPFAPPALVEKMLARLDGHWMYRREEDRQRLRMCRDCRVRDLFSRPRGAKS